MTSDKWVEKKGPTGRALPDSDGGEEGRKDKSKTHRKRGIYGEFSVISLGEAAGRD